jgi:ribosomal protein S18 acetylase RimI-like enzyme
VSSTATRLLGASPASCGTSPGSPKIAPPSSDLTTGDPAAGGLTGELIPAPQLSHAELDSLAALERACLESDGGRLKLEWPMLRNRSLGWTSDFIWVAGDEVRGFVGIYQWRPIAAELCGMVHPAWRRRGIGALLYDAAGAELSQRRVLQALLIVDRQLDSGRRFAAGRGGVLEHSEHRMQQRREPAEGVAPDLVALRSARAERGDVQFVAGCLAAAFEEDVAAPSFDDSARIEQLLAGTSIIERLPDREPVGVLRVEREGGVASIYGFGVLPAMQGRGYGQAALSALTRQLHRSGAGTISLEVLSTNDRALRLYTACGFDPVGTDDYYAMPISRPTGRQATGRQPTGRKATGPGR